MNYLATYGWLIHRGVWCSSSPRSSPVPTGKPQHSRSSLESLGLILPGDHLFMSFSWGAGIFKHVVFLSALSLKKRNAIAFSVALWQREPIYRIFLRENWSARRINCRWALDGRVILRNLDHTRILQEDGFLKTWYHSPCSTCNQSSCSQRISLLAYLTLGTLISRLV